MQIYFRKMTPDDASEVEIVEKLVLVYLGQENLFGKRHQMIKLFIWLL